jgi:hypothetical protein
MIGEPLFDERLILRRKCIQSERLFRDPQPFLRAEVRQFLEDLAEAHSSS